MRVPKRKSEEDRRKLQDNGPIYLSKVGIEKLKRTIEHIKRDIPPAQDELQRTREMGDLSENAAYQIAKHNLRRMQGRLFHLTERLKNAIEIQPDDSGIAQLGSMVVIAQGTGEKTYEIVGPLEADPLKGRISNISPLGNALLGHKKGDTVSYRLPSGEQQVRILNVY